MTPPFTTCEACGGPARHYFNDTPLDVALTAEQAAAKGVAADMVVDIPCGSFGLTMWGIVRIVDEPVETWGYLGDGPNKAKAKSRKEGRADA
jgi:hypothetical protein